MFLYQIEPQEMTDPVLGRYHTYGIGVYAVEAHHKEWLFTISDVFLDRIAARQFVRLCNRENLDPIHLNDVIRDTIGVP